MILLLMILLVGCDELVSLSRNKQTWDYIIIGAGPAGLQMGYFLQKSNRDYIILEKEDTAGSFFRKYPRHGRLNTINKVFTGSDNTEFNLRHDWHSLLTSYPELRFSRYSSEYFPRRESMLKYLQDFQARVKLNVRYHTEITKVSLSQRPNNQNVKNLFLLSDEFGNLYRCRTLLVATGMWKPVILDVPWMNLTEGYETISTDRYHYEAKNILILGHGNSAFDTAHHIYPHTNFVHVLGRSRVRLAWETHYAGDVRGVNNELFDTYQLKSLDGVFEGPLDSADFVERDGKFYIDEKLYTKDNFAGREGYDKIIRCLGFKFDHSIFTNETQLSIGKGKLWKYPLIDYDFQSRDVPGMYVIGASAHSLDYRQSAGGFIHGFRYSIRALQRILNWRNHGVRWHFKTLSKADLLSHIVQRINEGSGIYQMFGFLADVIAIRNNGTYAYYEEFPMRLLNKFPSSTGMKLDRFIVITLQYDNLSGPGKDVFCKDRRRTCQAQNALMSSGLHPVLYYHKNLQSDEDNEQLQGPVSTPDAVHHMLKDFLTRWDGDTHHITPLQRFIEKCIGVKLRHPYNN